MAPDHRDGARQYHRRTNHSPQSVSGSGHRLDWPNQPRPYKLYADLPALPLPEAADTTLAGLAAIANQSEDAGTAQVLDLEALASVLHYSNGITRRLRFDGRVMEFRAAACTGALYHIELYLVSGDLPGLAAGVYQFGAQDNALRRLRAGDQRGVLVAATAGDEATAHAPAVLVCTSTYWRNSWKYQERTYRHCFWDAGTVLANLLAVAAARGLAPSVVTGFVDDDVNLLLDLESEREVALALIPLGREPRPSVATTASPARLGLVTLPYSRSEVDYPAIRQIHAASSFSEPAQVLSWRRSPPAPALPEPSGLLTALAEAPVDALPRANVEAVIRARGSARAFSREAIDPEQLSVILRTACAPLSADYRLSASRALSDAFLIVRAVEGLASGAYLWRRESGMLELIAAGDFTQDAWHLDLGQPLAAQAAVDVYFLADLEPILSALGNRGYRAAQLDAAVAGGRAYLAAYALGLGATGLTFFDDDVIDFFGPHAAGRSVMFLIAIGVTARRGRH